MAENNTASGSEQRRNRAKPLKILFAALAIAALIKELRLPSEERTWHGALGGFAP